jgi:hypothetical protein
MNISLPGLPWSISLSFSEHWVMVGHTSAYAGSEKIIYEYNI